MGTSSIKQGGLMICVFADQIGLDTMSTDLDKDVQSVLDKFRIAIQVFLVGMRNKGKSAVDR